MLSTRHRRAAKAGGGASQPEHDVVPVHAAAAVVRRGGDVDDARLALGSARLLEARVEQVLHGEVTQVVDGQLHLKAVLSQLLVRVKHDSGWKTVHHTKLAQL